MLAYLKVSPTTYVLHYQGGRVRRQGPGLAFWYVRPVSTIVAVPLASRDVPFAFNEVTADFQPVTLQGQLTYRVADPARLAGLLDFSVRTSGQYLSDDPEKVPERLVQTAQTIGRAVVQRLTLRDALVSSDTIVAEILAALRQAEAVKMLGVEVLGLTIVAVKPTPETARALEADAREALLRTADEAIYARRNAVGRTGAPHQGERARNRDRRPAKATADSRDADCRRYRRRRAADGAHRATERERTTGRGRPRLHAPRHARAGSRRRLAYVDGRQRRRRRPETDDRAGVPRAGRERRQDRRAQRTPDLLTSLLKTAPAGR